VDSAVLSFAPKGGVLPQEDRAALAATLHRCFQQRRKQLGTILKGTGLTEEALPAGSEIAFALRPERLTPEQFLLLARTLRQKGCL
jgi:16S rRNA (adenine1518-N6/adenine1519-N6)-dimethyltransferase